MMKISEEMEIIKYSECRWRDTSMSVQEEAASRVRIINERLVNTAHVNVLASGSVWVLALRCVFGRVPMTSGSLCEVTGLSCLFHAGYRP